MTKADIVNRVATATGVTKLETEILVDGFFKTMADALANGDHIEIRGFGTFRTKKRSPRMARNPRTGETVALDEHFVPTFKPSRDLRQLIDDRQKSTTSSRSPK
ncbi:MAG: HU family DNA-binding protein [Bacteroidota bacterium]|nr:HU family DNA-binding protein [Bacteroidota bacterium]MDP4234723.1 HU family DNA-binding protein [Bacteroidota bacterium]MDP4243946.1 HU family DNA-binding protein [Bacteroidota bacterium]MDP4288831.1 HU family DNA-binding protein [Bacteroidota bacterium]